MYTDEELQINKISQKSCSAWLLDWRKFIARELLEIPWLHFPANILLNKTIQQTRDHMAKLIISVDAIQRKLLGSLQNAILVYVNIASSFFTNCRIFFVNVWRDALFISVHKTILWSFKLQISNWFDDCTRVDTSTFL